MIILASGSPRRKELLEQVGASFVVSVSDAAEESSDRLEPEELVRINAVAKAKAVAAEYPEKPVLGADTVVSLDGHTYGKPCDKNEACRMLENFSGRTHQVSTGIAMVVKGEIYTDVVTTKVTFGAMSQEEISRYVETGEPLDKAGAYAVQGIAARFIEKIEGSYSNVVGLPLHAVTQLARKAGVDLYDNHGEGFTR
ncbi:nucleoside triphosphate pyrophosphatase [Selenomonas sp. ND2010]|jgi:septum formation protein|uniref:Maf family protein n=1 Tax=Selenomonas sp. ND2010 TaxID=1410618 RepID=UPI00051C954D|nr:Maf family protein [Selenomonas sp. ND2010]